MQGACSPTLLQGFCLQCGRLVRDATPAVVQCIPQTKSEVLPGPIQLKGPHLFLPVSLRLFLTPSPPHSRRSHPSSWAIRAYRHCGFSVATFSWLNSQREGGEDKSPRKDPRPQDPEPPPPLRKRHGNKGKGSKGGKATPVQAAKGTSSQTSTRRS